MKYCFIVVSLIFFLILAACVRPTPIPPPPSPEVVPPTAPTLPSVPPPTPEPMPTPTPTPAPTEETYNPIIDPADFVMEIDNPYFPLKPGTTFIYQGETEEGIQRNEVVVTNQTKTILGVLTTVVWDRVWDEDDELVEETYDWYAQDKDGNVWYFGEDSKEYESGVVVSTAGSWEAGVDGAKPGIIMEADPQIGNSYRQEYYEGKAEDMAEVLSLSETASVPYGSFTDCLKTKEWTPLEPDVVAHKYYAPDVGFIMEIMVEGGTERVELIDIKTE